MEVNKSGMTSNLHPACFHIADFFLTIGGGKQDGRLHLLRFFSSRDCWFKQSCQNRFGGSLHRSVMTVFESEAWPVNIQQQQKESSGWWRQKITRGGKLVPGNKLDSSNTPATLTLRRVALSWSGCVCFMITEQTTASLRGEAQTLFALSQTWRPMRAAREIFQDF